MRESRRQEKTALEREAAGRGGRERIGRRIREESGVGVVEVILILVILIALVMIFRTQMTALVNTIFSTITSNANAVMQ